MKSLYIHKKDSVPKSNKNLSHLGSHQIRQWPKYKGLSSERDLVNTEWTLSGVPNMHY